MKFSEKNHDTLIKAFFDVLNNESIDYNELMNAPLSRTMNNSIWCQINSYLNREFNYPNILSLKSYWTRNSNFREKVKAMLDNITDNEKMEVSFENEEMDVEEENYANHFQKKVLIDYCDYKYQEKFISGNIRKKFLSKFNIFLSGVFQKNGRYY